MHTLLMIAGDQPCTVHAHAWLNTGPWKVFWGFAIFRSKFKSCSGSNFSTTWTTFLCWYEDLQRLKDFHDRTEALNFFQGINPVIWQKMCQWRSEEGLVNFDPQPGWQEAVGDVAQQTPHMNITHEKKEAEGGEAFPSEGGQGKVASVWRPQDKFRFNTSKKDL